MGYKELWQENTKNYNELARKRLDDYCKIEKLDKKIKELQKANNEKIDSLIAENSSQRVQIAVKNNQLAKLQEHIDVLENNPFRRLYNSITSMFKYKIKLVKIGDNQ